MAHRHGWMGRILAVLLASAMIVTSVPEAALTVRAAETTETVDAAADIGETDDQTIDLSENEWGGVETETPIPSEESNETEEAAEEAAPVEEGSPVEEEAPAEEVPADVGTPDGDAPAEGASSEEINVEISEVKEAEELFDVYIRSAFSSAEVSFSLKNPSEHSEYDWYELYSQIFYREKVDGEAGEWKQEANSWTLDIYEEGIIGTELEIGNLTSGKTYEYVASVSYAYPIESPDDIDSERVISSEKSTFTTPEDIRSLQDVDVIAKGISSAKITGYFSGGDGWTETYFRCFYKEEGTEDYSNVYASVYEESEDYWETYDCLTAPGTVTFLPYDLKAETTYEYIAVMDKDPIGSTYDADRKYMSVQKGSFKTQKDERVIEMGDPVVAFTRAELPLTLKNSYDGDYTSVAIYLCDDPKAETKKFKFYNTASAEEASVTWDFAVEKLEKEKDYACVAVLWKNNAYEDTYDPAVENAKVISASDVKTFSTKEDKRKIEKVEPAARITGVSFEVSFSGSIKGENTWAAVYYRTGTEGYTLWSYNFSSEASGTITIAPYNQPKLKKNTKYDYIVLLSGTRISGIDPTLELDSEAFKTYGILDKKGDSFETLDESRKVIDLEQTERTYTSVKVETGFEDSVEGELTYITMFYRDKKAGGNYQKKYSIDYVTESQEAKLTLTYSIGDYYYDEEPLTPGTTYEALVVLTTQYVQNWSISDLADISEDIRIASKTFEFSTLEEGRKVVASEPEMTYRSMFLQVGFTGNNYGDNAYVAAYYRKNGSGDAYQAIRELYRGYDREYYEIPKELEIGDRLAGLEPGTKYDYAVIFSDSYFNPYYEEEYYLSDEQLAAVPEGWKVTGTCATKAADYTVAVAHVPGESSIENTVLNVELGGKSVEENNDSQINAEIVFRDKDGNTVSDSVLLRRADDYKAVLETSKLACGKEYTVESVMLSVNDWVGPYTQQFVHIQTLEGNKVTSAAFTTVAKDDLTGVKITDAADQKLYLNAGTGEYKTVTLELTPATADWTQLDIKGTNLSGQGVVRVETKEISHGVVSMKVTPQKAGEVTFEIRSKKGATDAVLASFEVSVVDYKLAEVPTGAAPRIIEPDQTLSIGKGESFGPLAIYSKEKDSEVYTELQDAQVELANGMQVAWAKEDGAQVLKGVNIGSGAVTLMVNKYYPVKVNASVTVPCRGFVVNELINEERPAYPAPVPAQNAVLEATVAAGETYQIEGYLSPLNVKISEDGYRKLSFDADAASKTAGVTVSPYGEIDLPMPSNGKKYDVTVTVTPKADPEWTKQEAVTILLHVKPQLDASRIPISAGYVLSNVVKTLGDAAFDPDGPYKDWKWEADASTPLFNANVRGASDNGSRTFTAYYDGEDKNDFYPATARVSMNVITLTGAAVDIKANGSSISSRNFTVELDSNGKAAVDFSVNTSGINQDPSAVYASLIGKSQYQYVLTCGSSSGVEIKETAPADAKSAKRVEFSAKGKYTFTVKIQSKETTPTTLFTCTSTVTVVDSAQVDKIVFTKVTLNDNNKTPVDDIEDVLYNRRYEVVEPEIAKEGLVLTAKAVDSKGVNSATKLVWSSSDTSVVKVKADNNDSSVATITKMITETDTPSSQCRQLTTEA